MHYASVSFTHKNTDISVRERLSFSNIERKTEILRLLSSSQNINECMVLSTCNRVEPLAPHGRARLGLERRLARAPRPLRPRAPAGRASWSRPVRTARRRTPGRFPSPPRPVHCPPLGQHTSKPRLFKHIQMEVECSSRFSTCENA